MKLAFPSTEFDDAVAAVCHGQASEEQSRALNELLRTNAAARDEYILRLEIHSRLASEPNLFVGINHDATEAILDGDQNTQPENLLPFRLPRTSRNQRLTWVIGLAACVTLLAVGFWGLRTGDRTPTETKRAVSNPIAILNQTVNAQWDQNEAPQLGAALQPGWLRLNSGLVQIVLYSGVRISLEGPVQIELVSPGEIFCSAGRMSAEVPRHSRGVRIRTAQMTITDPGTMIGLAVQNHRTELHAFEGDVELQTTADALKQNLSQGSGAVAEHAQPIRQIAANRAAFTSLFDLQTKSLAVEAHSYDLWRAASRHLRRDPSLLVYFDFENEPSDWRLHNSASRGAAVSDASIMGCEWLSGRWPTKQALAFQSAGDRVRLDVPGEFNALTLATWVRIHGLDRQLNSLFMSDGFEPGEVHWLITHDGVLSLTVKGPGSGNFQILSSPAQLTLDRLGLWVHLAIVLDGNSKRAVHYVNGRAVAKHTLRLRPPFRIGPAELGNWSAGAFAGDDEVFLVRHFSGAMDEFCLFNRALTEAEMLALYRDGKPELGF